MAFQFSWMSGGQNSSDGLQTPTMNSNPFTPLSNGPAFMSGGITQRTKGPSIPKSDIEKQGDVVNCLKSVENRQPIPVSKIAELTQIDLNVEETVKEMLANNPKVQVTPDGLYSYVAKFNIQNSKQFLTLLNKAYVVSWEEIRDCYSKIEEDVTNLVREGWIICIENTEVKQRVFYPRGKPYFCEVSGEFEVRHKEPIAQPTEDAHLEVRRGDAIRLDRTWFRIPVGQAPSPHTVSSVKDVQYRGKSIPNFTKEMGMPMDRQYPFDQLDLLGRQDLEALAKQVQYILNMLGGPMPQGIAGFKNIVSGFYKYPPILGNPQFPYSTPQFPPGTPLEAKAFWTLPRSVIQLLSNWAQLPPAQIPQQIQALEVRWKKSQLERAHPGGSTIPSKRVKAVKYGCSNDIRELWQQTLEDFPKDDVDLEHALRTANLQMAGSFKSKRPLRFQKKEKKKRKKVFRQSKITNTHLEGSALADALKQHELQALQKHEDEA